MTSSAGEGRGGTGRPVRAARVLGAGVALFLVTLAVFWPALDNGFIEIFDDAGYVLENPQVRSGLNAASVAWAFRSTAEGNWHPLTWLSHMLDVELYGLAPRGHHATSVLIHAANAALLLWALWLLTHEFWPSVLAATLFALHPLHVESVAWIAERKDLLAGLWFTLALLAYARYARRPGAVGYALVLLALGAGLMAKPMLVSLPIVLLLLDAWPLGRIPAQTARTLIEKAPMLVLSGASAWVTVLAQQAGEAVARLDQVPAGWRVGNAAMATLAYLRDAAWPSRLAAFYPHAFQERRSWLAAAAAIAVIAISAAAFRARHRWPAVFTCWYAYLVMLLPVIGLVQVGSQGRADRYTYLPMVWIFLLFSLLLSRGVALLAGRLPDAAGAIRVLAAGLTALAIGLLVPVTRSQIRTWSDDVTVMRRAVDVSGDPRSRGLLAIALARAGRFDEAVGEARRVVAAQPQNPAAHYNLGVALLPLRRRAEAEQAFRTVLAFDPFHDRALANLGKLLVEQGRVAEGLEFLRRAVERAPGRIEHQLDLGAALRLDGRFPAAAAAYGAALSLDPRSVPAHEGLIAALVRMGDMAAAREAAVQAQRLGVDLNPEIVRSLGLAGGSRGPVP